MDTTAILADIGAHWHVYLTMPFTAAMIGYVTKRVAIEMMFRPLGARPGRNAQRTRNAAAQGRRRRHVGGHGDLPAAAVGDAADEVLTVRNVMEAVFTGPRADRLFALITREVQRTIDAQASIAKPWSR